MSELYGTPVTLLLLIAVVLVSGYALFAHPHWIDRLGFQPARITKEPYRYLTAGFVHGSLPHLLFNVVTLYFFGPLLEGELGSGMYFILYIGSSLCADTLTYFQHRGNYGYNAVGASGAISGVLFAYVLFAPYDMILFFGILPIPAVLFAFLFVVGSIYAIKTNKLVGIAHEAHLGGAIGGTILTIILRPDVVPKFLDQLL